MPPARTALALVLVVTGGCPTAHDRDDTRARDAATEDARADAWHTTPDLDARAFEAMRALAECDLARRCASRAEERLARELQRWCHPSVIASGDFEAVESGRLRFDPEAARLCLAAYDATCAWSRYYDHRWSECSGVYTGTVPDGGSCRSSLECSGAESYCRTEEMCPGTCAPRLDRGDPCTPGSCRHPYLCRSTGGANTCQGLVEGEACTTSYDCAYDLLCDESSVCAPKGGPGDPCGSADGLDTYDSYLYCDERLACLDTGGGTPTCVDPLSVGEGGPCVMDFLASCPDPLTCAVTDGYFGHCVLGAAPGAPCDPSAPCKVGSECIDGICRETVGPGGACDAERVCVASHECRSRRCEPLPLPGEPCAAGLCFIGACVDGTCIELPSGAPCTSARECAGYCSHTGTCADFLPSGAECVDSRGACARDHSCRSDASGTYRCLPECWAIPP